MHAAVSSNCFITAEVVVATGAAVVVETVVATGAAVVVETVVAKGAAVSDSPPQGDQVFYNSEQFSKITNVENAAGNACWRASSLFQNSKLRKPAIVPG